MGKEVGREGGGGEGRRAQLIMTGRNTLLQNYPKQLFDGPAGARKKAIGRIFFYLSCCQVSSLYSSSSVVRLFE